MEHADELVTKSIVGYKVEESDALLKFLYDHIATGADFQARVKWEAKSVIVWDVSGVALSNELFKLMNIRTV